MKFIFIALLTGILMSFSNFSYGSHASGAELTYECLGGNQYLIRLKFYRDCDGISAPTAPTINYSGCGGSGSLGLTQVNLQEVTPLCPTEDSQCNGGLVTGYEEYTYEATIYLACGLHGLDIYIL